MDRFKPLIEYYKNIKNLSNEILRIILFTITVYYVSSNYRKQFNVFIDLPFLFLVILIVRSYNLNIFTFKEFISYFIILLIVLGVYKLKIKN